MNDSEKVRALTKVITAQESECVVWKGMYEQVKFTHEAARDRVLEALDEKRDKSAIAGSRGMRGSYMARCFVPAYETAIAIVRREMGGTTEDKQ